jgi:trans-aconitate methyltransferase
MERDRSSAAALGGVVPIPEAGIDYERANAARMYDWFLGGSHNFAVDREQAARVLEHLPDIVTIARANRAYLGRVVRWCAERGIDQFLDLGSGVPTVGNVHEVARRVARAARVAYVDFEPVAVAHGRELLAGDDAATVTFADLRDPPGVMTAPGVAGLLDLTRPVAVLAVAVLHFVPDQPRPVADLLRDYWSHLVPGSVLAFSHSSHDQDDEALGARVQAGADAYRGSATESTLRSRAELRALLHGLAVVPPGIVDVTAWPAPRPGADPAGLYAGVGVVP